MATNLVELLSGAISPDMVQGLSKFVGEKESAVQNGLGALVPVLLGGMASKASTPSGASSLFSMLTGPNVDTGLAGNLGSLLASGQTSSILPQGSSLLSGLFGSEKASGLGSALAGVTGMNTASAGNLIALVLPFLFSILKKFIGERSLNPGGLASLLLGQREFLSGKLEPRLTTALGLGSPATLLSGLGNAAAPAVSAAGSTAAAAAETAGGQRWGLWIGGAVILALLAWMLSRCNTEQRVATAPAPTVASAPTTTEAPPMAATTTAPTSSAQFPAKIYFETGKADISPDGSATITAVAGALAANPATKVDITGYTDKTGDTATNEALAKSRALAVKSALVAAGVAQERVGTKPPMYVELGASAPTSEARRVEITPQP